MPQEGSAQKPTLKLMVITGTWPPMRCGVGDYTAMLCDFLFQLPVSIHVLTSRQARPDLRLSGHSQLEVHPRVEKWNYDAWRTIHRAIKEMQPDVVNIQWPTAVYGRSPAINLLPLFLRTHHARTPVVTTLHELRYFKALTRLRILPALVFSRRLIVVDPMDLEVIQTLYPPAVSRCRHIPIASNLPVVPRDFGREERRRQLGFTGEDFVVGFFGFANPPKGLETLFAALHKLKAKTPRIKFLLLSQFSDQNAYQRKLLRELKTSGLDAITVNPEYAEPRLAAEILASADCAALPFVDGVSVKRGSMLACLAQGLPMITTRPKRGEGQNFQDGANMLLVPPKDALALAKAIGRLMEDPDLRGRLALGAWDLARRFSWEDIARRQLEVFTDALAGKS